MQESLTSKYDKLLSFRHEEDMCSWTAIRLTLTSSCPSFRVHRKLETLVPSAMNDT